MEPSKKRRRTDETPQFLAYQSYTLPGIAQLQAPGPQYSGNALYTMPAYGEAVQQRAQHAHSYAMTPGPPAITQHAYGHGPPASRLPTPMIGLPQFPSHVIPPGINIPSSEDMVSDFDEALARRLLIELAREDTTGRAQWVLTDCYIQLQQYRKETSNHATQQERSTTHGEPSTAEIDHGGEEVEEALGQGSDVDIWPHEDSDSSDDEPPAVFTSFEACFRDVDFIINAKYSSLSGIKQYEKACQGCNEIDDQIDLIQQNSGPKASNVAKRKAMDALINIGLAILLSKHGVVAEVVRTHYQFDDIIAKSIVSIMKSIPVAGRKGMAQEGSIVDMMQALVDLAKGQAIDSFDGLRETLGKLEQYRNSAR